MSDLAASTTAHWHCLGCGLATEPFRGAQAVREATHLAAVHDLVHHRGARSARVVISDCGPLTITSTEPAYSRAG